MLTPASPLSERLRFALKLGALPKLLVPALLGTLVGALDVGRPDVGAMGVVLGYVVFDAPFILLLNDVGDEPVDRIRRAMFPEQGRKTIVDGLLTRRTLVLLGVSSGALALALAWAGGLWLHRPWLGPMGAVGLMLFVAYTFPPLRLNYRGGGELVEGGAVGGALIAFCAYAQAGRMPPLLLALLPTTVLLGLASAVASGLSDETSDRAGGKRTVAVVAGNPSARHAINALVAAAPLTLVLASWLPNSPLGVEPAVVAALVIAAFGLRMRRALAKAETLKFAHQSEAKRELARAILLGELVLGIGLIVDRMSP